MGCDLIQLKLVKIVADQFAEPLTCIINSAFTQSIFPNKAKEASDTPFDKGENSKQIFDHITICAKEFLSIFMRAYRKHYGTQHVLVHLLEE